MLGAGSILAGAFIGAGIGALSTTAMKAGEEISTGNVRSAGERLAYAVFDDSMSWDEKWAYAFDPEQMVADFVTGVVIGEFLDGMMAATQNKLRSIFANYDAAMREAIESGSTSKYLEQLDNLSENKINHMIDGSKNSNHGWEKLVPDKNWSDIKNIIADAMDTGVEGPYKSVLSKKATINGFEVEVTYTKLSDGTIKISDAWVNQ